jgi:Ser/Thr protein kinase RdoA (MazF antagonist)
MRRNCPRPPSPRLGVGRVGDTFRVVEVRRQDVERALGRAVSTYDVTPLDPHLRLHSVTGGVFRVTADGDEAVLKVVRHGLDDDPGALWVAGGDVAHRNYWKREWLAFDSGLLAGLPPGVRAPRALATTQPHDEECWIWMEAVRGRTAEAIRLEEYPAIAEALGRTQGWFASDASRLPSYEWLSRDWLRGWADTSAGALANVRGNDGWHDPRLASLVPWRKRALDVWARRDPLLHVVETAPQTVVHLDFWPHNLFLTDSGEVVAIDWSQVGIGGVAQDLDQITLDTVWMHVHPDADLEQLESAVLPAYAEGLRAGGFDVADESLRLWYAAAAAVKYVPLLELQVTQLRDPAAVARAEQRFGRPFAEVTATKSRVVRRAVELGEWALRSLT